MRRRRGGLSSFRAPAPRCADGVPSATRRNIAQLAHIWSRCRYLQIRVRFPLDPGDHGVVSPLRAVLVATWVGVVCVVSGGCDGCNEKKQGASTDAAKPAPSITTTSEEIYLSNLE